MIIPNLNPDEVRRRLRCGTIEVPAPAEKPVTSPCWVPESCVLPDGDIVNMYRNLSIDGIRRDRHVWASYVNSGNIDPSPLQATHLCDRKSCCNPDHIKLDTAKSNTAEAVARNLMPTHPHLHMPSGEKNRMTKISDEIAAQLKWLLANKNEWFSEEISQNHDLYEALAIHFQHSKPSIRVRAKMESWRSVVPQKPSVLPTIHTIPADSKPPLPQRMSPIGAAGAKQILLAWKNTKDRRHFVRDQAMMFGVSTNAIRSILSRKIFAYVAPEIPPADFSQSGNQKLTDREIQEIRATWDAHHSEYGALGLLAALGRKYRITPSYVKAVAQRVMRIEVPEDPSAIVPVSKLEFKDLTPRGTKHPRHKLSDDDVWQILERRSRGESAMNLAKDFRVSPNIIYNVSNGQTRREIFERFQNKNMPPPVL